MESQHGGEHKSLNRQLQGQYLLCHPLQENLLQTDSVNQGAEKTRKTRNRKDKQYKCDQCGRICRLYISYKKHLESHSTKKFDCNFCSKSFKLKWKRDNHMITHDSENAFECKTCGKSFKWSSSYSMHIKRFHAKDNPFVCLKCGLVLSDTDKLEEHMKTHLKFHCDKCPEGFLLKTKFVQHMKRHREEKGADKVEDKCFDEKIFFICEMCGRSGIRPGHCLSHQKKAHGGDCSFKCSRCGQSFREAAILIEHHLKHRQELFYKCTSCDKAFTHKKNLLTHIEAIHGSGETQYPCSSCPKQFATQLRLRTHIWVNHPTHGPLVCHQCGKTFKSRKYLTRHMYIHQNVKPYKCKLCGKCFNHCANMKRHMVCHTGEKPFMCSACGNAYTQSGALKVHIKNCHSDESKGPKRPYRTIVGHYSPAWSRDQKCLVCDKTFQWRGDLVRHMKEHREEELYQCKECGLTFLHRPDLEVHLKVHGENLKAGRNFCAVIGAFVCKICGKRFKTSQYREAHMAMHTGDGKYQCEVCSKRFFFKQSLEGHMFSHTGEKPFICDECGRGFGNKGNLARHKKLHAGERPFKCDTCGKCFSQRPSLNIHKRVHTGEKPYKCDECGQAFTEKRSLLRHKPKHVKV